MTKTIPRDMGLQIRYPRRRPARTNDTFLQNPLALTSFTSAPENSALDGQPRSHGTTDINPPETAQTLSQMRRGALRCVTITIV